MGRFYAKPYICWKMDSKNDTHPKLKWHKVIHNYEHAGDILASFELVAYQVGI